MIPYGRQLIDEDDIKAVTDVLRSDWLTTGPKVEEFEKAVCDFTGARHAVAVSSGTAALHTAMFAIGIKPGDEVIVSPMTFAASANCVLYQGGVPVFADVEPETLLIDPIRVIEKISSKTKAIIAVDYAGQPCDYDVLRSIAGRHHLVLIADACHSLGGSYRGRPTGSLADLSAFSFHPVKHITTGEGGMIVTNTEAYAARMRVFRNHGITTDHRQRQEKGSWFYEMVDLGYNYRITDFQCALGLSQLKKLPGWIARRQEIARKYDAAFVGSKIIRPLVTKTNVVNAYHLYVVRFSGNDGSAKRQDRFTALRAAGIGVNVHYIPVHMHPFYVKKFGHRAGMCPIAEQAYEVILSLPMFPTMHDNVIDQVVEILDGICR